MPRRDQFFIGADNAIDQLHECLDQILTVASLDSEPKTLELIVSNVVSDCIFDCASLSSDLESTIIPRS